MSIFSFKNKGTEAKNKPSWFGIMQAKRNNNIYKHTIMVNGKEYTTDIDISPEAIKQYSYNKSSAKYTQIPYNHTRVNIDDFIKTYMSAIPIDLFNDMQNKSMQGFDYYDLPNETIENIKTKRNQQNEFNDKLRQTASLNNKGIEYEKEGKIDKAISVYEENIKIGNPAHHAFKRLMILYRKNNDYENEHRVILRAIEVFPNCQEYSDRLNKVEQLINKILQS